MNNLKIIFFLPFISFGWINWKTLESDKFQIIYKPGFEKHGKECLKIMEYYQKDVTNLTGHKLSKTPIVIEDIGIISNGYTNPIFRNIHLFTYPPNSFSELGFTQNWWRIVGIHEYTHMAHLTRMEGIPFLFATLGGNIFQPNIWSPSWLTEGIATYSESQISPYEGRINDGFFDAYISACASEGKFPSLLDVTYLPIRYPYWNGKYIYGGKFFYYLSQKYGKERFAYFFKKKGSSILSYVDPIFPAINMDMITSNSFFNKDFMFLQKDFPFLFEEWKYYEIKINKTWRIDGERLTHKGGNIHFLYYSNNKLYYVREKIIKTNAVKNFWFTEIVEYDLSLQKENNVVSLTTYITSPLKIVNSKMYYSTLDINKGYANISYLGFGFIANLHQRDLKNKKDKVILRDEIRSFAVLSDEKILYSIDKKDTFGSKLYIYFPESKRKEEILNTDLLIGEIEASDKYIIVVARHNWENWDIYLFDINSKTFTPIIKTPYKESSIFLKGDKLFFVANYNKIYACYAYDFVTKNLYKLTEIGYANFPVYDDLDSTLYFVGITSEGNDLYKKRINFKNIFIPSEDFSINNYPQLPELKEIKKGGYLHTLNTLIPAIHLPLVFPIDTTFKKWSLGLWLMGRDAIGYHNYEIFFLSKYFRNKPYWRGTYTSCFLSPLVTFFELDNSSPLFSVTLAYPLFYKLDNPFSYFQVSLRSTLFDTAFSRKVFSPYIGVEFNYPKTTMLLTIAYFLEWKSLGSSINREGVAFIGEMRKYIKQSEINTIITGFYDPDISKGNGLLTREPFFSFYAPIGVAINVDYSFPLLKIRKGMWNPNFYIEDLCISLFSDFVYAYKDENNFFIGSEMKFEIGWFFQDAIRTIPKLGLGVNKKRELKIYVGFDMSSWSESNFSPKQKIYNFLFKNNFLKFKNIILKTLSF